MKKTLALLALLLAFLPGALTAQTAKKATAVKASAVLEYSDDETQLIITDAAGNTLVPADGLVLPLGAVVKTLKTTAEIRLNPNGTIIKLSASTTFKIETLRESDGTGSNDFALLGGKIRTVAAKLTGATTPGYNVRTPTANCGVRGTDFAMKFDPENNMDWVCVQEGQVDFTNITTGATVPVAMNEFANTFDEVFGAAPVDAARLAELFADVDFVKLNPLEVPSKALEEVAQAAAVETPEETAEKDALGPTAGNDIVYEFLKKFFGLEVGSVTINGTTYSKAVLSPVLNLDGFKLGLYLPIVYTRDMFDPSDWYRPGGNDEWSFGTDQNGWVAVATDAAQDLALKIKYLEWGNQEFDDNYLKLGNLKTMSLGHGTVVRNFANDQDFPAIRKIGLNAGVKFGGFSIEGLADDVAKPAIVGGRLALDLIGDQVVFGVQTTVDLHLANNADLIGSPSGNLAGYYGDPMLLVGGFDLQLFKLDFGGMFRTKAFADVNTVSAYFRTASTFADQGFSVDTIWHDGLGSLGGEAGFLGNIAIVNYRLSFQAERGLYSNAIFQGNYYRTRTELLTALEQYLTSPDDSNLNMGVYGSADFDLFGMLTFEGAYRWPFELKADGTIGPSDSDYLKLKLSIPKDKIPFVKLSGGVAYARTQFLPSIRDGVSLFDANTVLRGEVVYGLAQSLDLVIGVSTTTIRDGDGNVIYENNKPKIGPTVSLDTKLSF